jgi:fibronectin-binding autotransporter adhesin
MPLPFYALGMPSLRRALVAGFMFVLIAPSAIAQSTWSGGSATTSNWSDTANWSASPPVDGGTSGLIFGGTVRLSPNDDFASYSATSIVFNSGAGAFTLGGNGINLGGSVTNNSTALQTISQALTLTADGTFSATSGSITVGGAIGGSFNLNVSGTGANVVTLTGTNGYTGNTAINSGTLSISADPNLGTPPAAQVLNNITLSGGGILDVTTGFTLNTAKVRGITVGAGGGTIVTDSGTFTTFQITGGANPLTVDGNGNTTFPTTGLDASHVSGSLNTSGTITKNGPGTLRITGNNTVAGIAVFTGAITVNGGTLSFEQSNSFGNTGGVAIPVTINNGATLATDRAGSNLAFFNGGRAIVLGAGSETLSLLATGSATLIYTASSTGGIQGAGNLTLTMTNPANTLVLALAAGGAANTNTGSITISSGRLQTGNTTANGLNVLSPNSPIILPTGGILNLAGYSQTIASLSDGGGAGGSVVLGATGAATLTVGGTTAAGNNLSTTFSGIISGAGTAGGLIKNGTGTFTLSGPNTYGAGAGTGTTVNSGVLSVTNTTGSGTGTGFVTVNGGSASGALFGTLGGTGTITGPVTVNAGITGGPNGVIKAGTAASNFIGTLNLGGNLTLPGTYNAVIDPATTNSSLLAVTGNVDLTGGTLIVSSLAGSPTNTYTLLTYGGTLTGNFASTTLPPNYTISYGSGAASAITISFVPVPEPTCILLLCSGATGAFGWWKRRRDPKPSRGQPTR